ncbi:metacaspase [Angomonas deanei]|uniref:Caspase domain containing protein, putative n=1 Tax=Angomonas deanei TaxID=59799 RepID=S9VGJ8_9TRYP|nr:metacaspase [Angomonas deanei]EPY40033.1 metacaspase [Angomonas deanei]EPY42758.1 metacaspase [Angomonas deanei]CAD2216901.1 Caspase domain containing protein, putative [Angomonas deanei]|eukprot:EPY28700.1 metacaspase [Angomonas deanei]
MIGLGMLVGSLVAPVLANGLLKVDRPKPVNYAQAHQEAQTVRPVIPYRAPVPYTGGRVRALFIGINYTGTKSALRGCVNDCFTMLGTLQQIKFPISECCVLVDDPKFPNFTAYPTRDNMIKYLAWLVHDVRPGDVLFLHYSGHGGQTKSKGDREEAYDQCLIPLDYMQKGSILDDDLFNLLIRNLPAGVRMTCVFDCCHSATMLDLPFSFIASSNVSSGQQGYYMKQVRRDNFSNGDVLMFSGCDDAGTSADVGSVGGAATQAFTWALLNTAGLNIMDILLKTREILRQKKYKQVPQLTASKPINLYKPFSLFGMLNQDQQQMHHVPQQYQAPPPGQYNNQYQQAPPQSYQQPPPQQQQYPPAQYSGAPTYPPPQQQPQYNYNNNAPPAQYNYNPQSVPPPPPGGYPQALPGPQYGNYNQYNSL